MNLLLTVVLAVSVVGCTSYPSAPTQSTDSSTIQQPELPSAKNLWIGPGVPEQLRQLALGWKMPLAAIPNVAGLRLDVQTGLERGASQWIYALVAPFPTVLDGISTTDLYSIWTHSSRASFGNWPLLMTASTLSAFSAVWGAPKANVQVEAPDELLDAAWQHMPCFGIIPFESIEPRWKVLTVNNQSPIRKDFKPATYPLVVRFALSVPAAGVQLFELPETNRDESKLTIVVMSGTSALVREIAYQMEVEGLDYPSRDIGDWLRQADIFHVSHETSFDPSCPPPNPLKNRFYCSDPKYIALFDDVGVDVVELTGNHILDNGVASMLFTLDLYRAHHISYFGGGANLEEARKPLLIEHHGNKIAFSGCNFAEPPQPLAEANVPGANPCDWKYLQNQIRQLREQGYIPITTFQYKEGYSPVVMPWQSIDFRRAAEAGAEIVSGSQSHVPLQMEFFEGAFIHYGLGNLFFGQMANQPPGPGLPLQPAERYEFLDRHVIYDGRYLTTELLTAFQEDYGRPRPMNSEERAALLQAYFGYSGWLPLMPTPAPLRTPTLYPLLDFIPLPTHTPLPDSTPLP